MRHVDFKDLHHKLLTFRQACKSVTDTLYTVVIMLYLTDNLNENSHDHIVTVHEFKHVYHSCTTPTPHILTLAMM